MLTCNRFPATSVSIERPLLNGSAVDRRLSLQEVAILGGQASDASWYATLVGLVDRSSTLTCRRIFIQWLRPAMAVPSERRPPSVGWTPHPQLAPVQCVDVGYRRTHVPLPQQLLHGTDVAAVGE